MQRMDFIVDRKQWRECEFVAAEPPEPADGQVVFRVDHFAFTSNNISYALTGDALDYWGFFPAPEGRGRIPVMGYGEVLRSRCDAVAEGERFFGFYPMSTHLAIDAQTVGENLVDTAPHRSSQAPAYRQYLRSSADPVYTVETEPQIVLLRGLFMTSFLVDDFLADSDHFGAKTLVVSSASSKTSIALAFQASRRGHARIVGLTSPRNAAFVAGLGYYDEVLHYDEVESLPADAPTVFVDMAGNAEVVRALHQHLGDSMRYNCVVGATHWDRGGRSDGLPGAEPKFFFAPAQIVKRSNEWGPAVFQERLGGDWKRFCAASDAWLRVQRGVGPDAVQRVFLDTLDGKTEPRDGHVLSLWEN